MSCNCGCNCESNNEKTISMKGVPVETGEVVTVKAECECENNCQCGDYIVNKDVDKNITI